MGRSEGHFISGVGNGHLVLKYPRQYPARLCDKDTVKVKTLGL
jgi:hypothetical protein